MTLRISSNELVRPTKLSKSLEANVKRRRLNDVHVTTISPYRKDVRWNAIVAVDTYIADYNQ